MGGAAAAFSFPVNFSESIGDRDGGVQQSKKSYFDTQVLEEKYQ